MEQPSVAPLVPSEHIRRVLIPGIAAIVIVWLVQSAIDRYCPGPDPAWTHHMHIPFTRLPPFIHWGLTVSFAVAGAISALYGAFDSSSLRQRYIAALFPAFFEILKWAWLLRFPLAPWIDPARPPYRFTSLPLTASISYWVVHIIIPAAATMGVFVLLQSSVLSTNHGRGIAWFERPTENN